jgi:hypothetical protein
MPKPKRKAAIKPTHSVERKLAKKKADVKETNDDFDKVGVILDNFRIGDTEALPEEYEHYLNIPFNSVHEIMADELHMHMACTTHQLGYLENLVSNAQIEVNQLMRDFARTAHDNYSGQNKKMAAEKAQLDSGVWEDLDIANGVLSRVQVERNRLADLYKFFSRMLSSRQGGL